MRYLSVYLYCPKKVLVVPEMVQTQAGFYMESDPVHIASLDEIGSLRNVFENWLERSMKIIPTPAREQFTSVVDIPSVRAVKAKSYTDFVRHVLLWHIEQFDDGGFQIQRWISPPRENSFVPHKDDSFQLPAGTSVEELSNRFSEIVRLAKSSEC